MFRLQLADDIALDLLEEEDAAELYALVDANREHLQRFLPWARIATPENERAFVRASLERFARGAGFDGRARAAGTAAAGPVTLYVDGGGHINGVAWAPDLDAQ